MDKIVYSSAIAPYIRGFVDTKKALGFKYNVEELVLKQFDRYWTDTNGSLSIITAASLDKWLEQRSTEGKSSLQQRINTVRLLCLYMSGLGLDVYVPNIKVRRSKPLTHVFTQDELKELFAVIDSFRPIHQSPSVTRMALSYPVLFRLYATTGLRRTEAITLKRESINWENNSVTILNAKGGKDRVIFLANDMAEMLQRYLTQLNSALSEDSLWLFPAADASHHMSSGALAIRFRSFWKQTRCSRLCEKAPTIHSFRHTFVVSRINLWMKQGMDISVLLPYLSQYLGHKSERETYYYYHQVLDAFELIRKKDPEFNEILPEARTR